MFLNILLLELKKNLKSPAFYIFSLILFGSTLFFVLMTNPHDQFMGLYNGKEWHNAPVKIAQMFARLSVFGLLFSIVLVGRSVTKDFEANMHEIIFTRPVSKWQYLGGRFWGSLIANMAMYISIILAFIIGNLILGDSYSGPFRLGAYLMPFIITLIPNLILIGSMFFALATLSRKMISTYMAGVGFLAIYSIIGILLHKMSDDTWRILLDPFGINGLSVQTKFWTIADMNNNLMPVNTAYLINRIFWLCIGLGFFYITYIKFRFEAIKETREKKSVQAEETEIKDYHIVPPVFSLIKNNWFHFRQCLQISWSDFRRILVHPAFLILLVLALSQIETNFVGGLGNHTGRIYPFTSWYIAKAEHLWFYMLPIIIFFGGMLVWKEHDNRTNEIIDTLPVPNWMNYVSKLLTLVKIQVLYLILAIFTGVFTQVVLLDFTDIELGLYFKQLFGIDFLNYLHMAIIVIFIQNYCQFIQFSFKTVFNIRLVHIEHHIGIKRNLDPLANPFHLGTGNIALDLCRLLRGLLLLGLVPMPAGGRSPARLLPGVPFE